MNLLRTAWARLASRNAFMRGACMVTVAVTSISGISVAARANTSPAVGNATTSTSATAPPVGPLLAMPRPSATAAAPVSSTVAKPSDAIVTLTGRVLDMQNKYVFFSTGGSYRLAPQARIVNADQHAPFAGDDVTGYYARTGFGANGSIVSLELTHKVLPLDDFKPVERFAVALSTPYSNPDFSSGADGFTGEPVLVSFTVAVPPETALTDNVYISTESSRWDAMEIHMDRIDALHYRITRRLNSGTNVIYRYTRGSWRSSERGRDGIEGPPRSFIVRNADVARRDDIVYHWSNESADGSQSITPDSIPTPFNNKPFSQVTPKPLGE